jgi:LPXTG-motif cell wall-anchored protein
MRTFRLIMLLAALFAAALGVAHAAGPTLTVTAPTDGAQIEGRTVTVVFTAGDFAIVPSTVPLEQYGKRPDLNKPHEGHLHLTLDLQPLVVWDRNAPYTFTDVPPGEHQLKVELANNDHSSLSPPVFRTLRFRTISPARMPTTGEADAPTALALLALAAALAGIGLLLRRRAA